MWWKITLLVLLLPISLLVGIVYVGLRYGRMIEYAISGHVPPQQDDAA